MLQFSLILQQESFLTFKIKLTKNAEGIIFTLDDKSGRSPCGKTERSENK